MTIEELKAAKAVLDEARTTLNVLQSQVQAHCDDLRDKVTEDMRGAMVAALKETVAIVGNIDNTPYGDNIPLGQVYMRGDVGAPFLRVSVYHNGYAFSTRRFAVDGEIKVILRNDGNVEYTYDIGTNGSSCCHDWEGFLRKFMHWNDGDKGIIAMRKELPRILGYLPEAMHNALTSYLKRRTTACEQLLQTVERLKVWEEE